MTTVKSNGVTAEDVTATLVSTSASSADVEVSMKIRSDHPDEIKGAAVDPSFGSAVAIAAFGGSSGGDGHLGHLDPKPGETHTHTHGGKVAIDLPADTGVTVGAGGVATLRVLGVRGTPVPGDVFKLTLDFQEAPDLVLNVPVDS